MNSSTKAIILETIGVIVFVILCNASWYVPTYFLVGFLFCLQVGLVWMTISILKDTQAQKNTPDDPVTFH